MSISNAIDKGVKFHFNLRANKRSPFIGITKQFKNRKMVNDRKLYKIEF